MSFTGEFIKFAGLLSLATGSTALLFLLSRLWSFIYSFRKMEGEFEGLWEKYIRVGSSDEKLANLSYVHKATKRQMQETEKVDLHLLNRAIKEADENKSLLKSRNHQLYYVASEKLRNLKKEAKRAGKI